MGTTRKGLRADNTYLIEGNRGDNPKLMGRELADGRDSLYLEYFDGKTEATSRSGRTYMRSERHTEQLCLYLWRVPRSPLERQQNRETLELAKRQRFERGQELLERGEGYRLRREADADLLAWMRGYYDVYTRADRRHIKRAYECFVDYLTDAAGTVAAPAPYTREEREAVAADRAARSQGLRLKPRRLTREMAEGFAEYLQRRFRGEGAHTVFARFKKMIRAAVAAEVLHRNPCDGVTIKIDVGTLKKDVLSLEEMRQLIATHCPGENADVRRAFIFCLYSGLRWCDVRELTYADVDRANRLLRFEQLKTRGRSAASGVVIPLSDTLLRLIGEGERGELIFRLPSHTMCLKALRHWTQRAGIDKHITWHCARHSFAVNILNGGANIKTVASLLGHSGLRHTEKYTRAVDSLKVAAINSLPEPEL